MTLYLLFLYMCVSISVFILVFKGVCLLDSGFNADIHNTGYCRVYFHFLIMWLLTSYHLPDLTVTLYVFFYQLSAFVNAHHSASVISCECSGIGHIQVPSYLTYRIGIRGLRFTYKNMYDKPERLPLHYGGTLIPGNDAITQSHSQESYDRICDEHWLIA